MSINNDCNLCTNFYDKQLTSIIRRVLGKDDKLLIGDKKMAIDKVSL